MGLLWISLPPSWKLQDVQATLNVIVSVLSALCIFVFARVCWQTATAKVVKNRNVPLAALLSVNTVGEVADVCRLLGLEILSSYYIRILAQCIVVTLLTVAAFLSGPIARYSTSRGTKIVSRNVHGLLANRLSSGLSHETVLWNETWSALDRARFPTNRILEFLPDNAVDWRYVPAEWNSSWSMHCDRIELTPIELYITNDNCSSLNQAIPAMATIIDEPTYDDEYTDSAYQSNWEGVRHNEEAFSDVLMFRFSWIYKDWNNDTETWESIKMAMLAIHMQDFPSQANPSSGCDFGKGAVGRAHYTKAVCDLERVGETTIENDYTYGAYPDHDSLDFVPLAYTSYFQARFYREVNAGNATTIITPDDLIRFYQVYLVTQDTQKPRPVPRALNVELSLVRLSTIFLISCVALTFLCAFGTAKYGVFSLRHYGTVDRTPQSKLDWMLQSIECQGAASTPGSARPSRYSFTTMLSPDLALPSRGRKRTDFETATYGLKSPELSTPYHSGWLSRQISDGSDGSYFPLQPVLEQGDASQASLLTKHPAAPPIPTNIDHYPHQVFYRLHNKSLTLRRRCMGSCYGFFVLVSETLFSRFPCNLPSHTNKG